MTDTASVTITGILKTTGGTPLANQPLTYTDDAGDTIPGATTDANGNYSVTFQASAPHPAEKFTVNFAGVAGTYGPSSASATADIIAGTTLTINLAVS